MIRGLDPPMRRLHPLALTAAAVVLGACSSFEPGWTVAPETPTPSADASASAPASEAPASEAPAADVTLTALNIAFDPTTLTAPADAPFTFAFANQDAGVPHDVDIRDPGGTSVFKTEIFNGAETRTYDVPALTAGSYTFSCTVHPNMTGTLTAG